MPGQELGEPLDGMIGDASEHVGEPGLRVDIVELSGGDQGVYRSRALAAAVGAGEKPGPAPQGDEALIVPSFFKCLETLKVDFGDQCDTGDLFAQ